MKKILFTLFLAVSGLALSQTTANQKLVFVDGALASQNFINKNKKNVQSTTIITNNNQLPSTLKSFTVNAQSPIINVQVKDNFYDKITLASLNEQNELAADNPVLFDGRLLTNTKLKVIHNAISQTSVILHEGKKVLSISTAL